MELNKLSYPPIAESDVVSLIKLLNKDFSLIGCPIDLCSNLSFKELLQELYSFLSENITNGQLDIYQLLYRIDVSETVIRNTDFKSLESLMQVLLERMHQKIELRKKYK